MLNVCECSTKGREKVLVATEFDIPSKSHTSVEFSSNQFWINCDFYIDRWNMERTKLHSKCHKYEMFTCHKSKSIYCICLLLARPRQIFLLFSLQYLMVATAKKKVAHAEWESSKQAEWSTWTPFYSHTTNVNGSQSIRSEQLQSRVSQSNTNTLLFLLSCCRFFLWKWKHSWQHSQHIL